MEDDSMKTIEERFLTYVAIDTQSEDGLEMVPSTPKQRDLGELLVKELKELGLKDVMIDDHCYVYGTLPANGNAEKVPVIGFLAHMDTATECSGKDVKARIVPAYDGGDIVLNEANGMVLSPKDFACLNRVKGHDLVVTDGTTLLGGDNKAGVADIMSMLDYYYEHPEVKHGTIKVAFTPDEEVGNGPKFFDVKGFGADFAYTVDGGAIGCVSYETFNACSAKITVKGRQTHPGATKDQMKNALLIAMEFNSMLPKLEVPEHTENREGFYHLGWVEGSVGEAQMAYILRDHDRGSFEHRKETMQKIADFLNARYGEGTVELTLKDSYYNMAEVLKDHMHCVEHALDAYRRIGIEPVTEPIRGGTDGARLSFMGLPCPNLSDGDYNAHSLYEFVSLTEMKQIVKMLMAIVEGYYEEGQN